MPSNPGKMLDRLSTKSPPAKRFKYTLIKQITLNYTLLENSFPENIKLY